MIIFILLIWIKNYPIHLPEITSIFKSWLQNHDFHNSFLKKVKPCYFILLKDRTFEFFFFQWCVLGGAFEGPHMEVSAQHAA